MKYWLTLLSFLLSFHAYAQELAGRIPPELLQKASISKMDSLITLKANSKKEHRLVGYESPNIKSTPLMLFSIFTAEVEGNPQHLAFGAYYETAGMGRMELKYLGNDGPFIKAALTMHNNLLTEMYFESTYFEFE
ncbi:MAG: hypothetical protein JNJ58_00915 [Chitinophagaceae bacterium]|nr:hypothetical protein [Chitinophagaceae bacterium]